MSWTGEPGAEGKTKMATEEIVFNMARLSLTGNLNRAISEYGPWKNLVPYYEWNPEVVTEKFLPQISVRSFAAQCETLPERELTILLKILSMSGQILFDISKGQHARCLDVL